MAEKIYCEQKNEQKIKAPKMYQVILLNDHYTTMEFVVEVLTMVFHKSVEEATKIMLDVHQKGQGTVGIYSYDIAITKVVQVEARANQHEFPLKAIVKEV